ncbi:MAG TPA: ATP-binding protein, partial [Alicycliphilus sp.]|nr:ATP-binding protein [Alicycliphilus sp.]
IVQEALSNVRKHAGARGVQLCVQRHPQWRFEVRDDGQGFDPSGVPPDSLHVGLGIMQERAQRIGAELTLDTRAGVGTCVTLLLPPPARSESSAPEVTIAAP